MYGYEELRVSLFAQPDGSYRVDVSGTGGDAAGLVQPPFTDLEVENFILRVGRTRRGVRRLQSPEMASAQKFGGRLFETVFQGKVRDVYRRSLDAASDRGLGVRISLRLAEAPRLRAIPWEFLFDEPDFLSISTWTPVVRYLDLPSPRRPLAVDGPLRILGVVSNPEGTESLDVEDEQARLGEALGDLIASGAAEITWLARPTLGELQRALTRGDYHVFHFIGHGGFDDAHDDGALLFEDDRKRPRLVTGWDLGTLLRDETSLRLAVLNACEGARTSVEDPFAGVAAGLVERGMPAVVAMQFEVTDQAAIVFADGFYSALARGFPVDAAMAEGRKAVFADGNDVEWATGVLFMRVADGRLFDVSGASAASVRPATTSPVPARARSLAATRPEARVPPMPDDDDIEEPEIPDHELAERRRARGGRGRVSDPVAAPTPTRATSRQPELVGVPAGPFLFGPERRRIELPAFRIGRFPVTNGEFAAYVEEAGIPAPRHWEGPRPPARIVDHPVVWVSWERATAYCRWLAYRSDVPFRLPSEEEWEKAARGRDGRLYPWGDDFDLARVKRVIRSMVPVGTHSPAADSPYGVADMMSLRQWTGANPGSTGHFVVRGHGDGLHRPEAFLVSIRSELTSGAKATIGFRLAVSG
jgi:formylglycine-generating enzyme required for sulfatase activity